MPEPIRIGRNTLWRPEVLRAWVAAGCPAVNSARWQEYREATTAKLAGLPKGGDP